MTQALMTLKNGSPDSFQKGVHGALPGYLTGSFKWPLVWQEVWDLIKGHSPDAGYLWAQVQETNTANEQAPLISPVIKGQWYRPARVLIITIDLHLWGQVVLTFQPDGPMYVITTIRVDKGANFNNDRIF